MNEVVKYNNYMNDLKLKDFTSVDLNFLMFICAKMRDMDTKEITFDFSMIKEITGYDCTTSNKRFVDELERMNKKLMEVTCRLKTEDRILMFVLFPTFEINLKNNTLTVSVNERFKFILNALVDNFTRFELAEFINLNSKYSKNLYRYLKQFRSTGVLKITDIEDFKKKMGCPDYKPKDFMSFVLKPALEELKPYFQNLVCEPQKARKRGSPVTGYIFTFEPEKVPAKESVQAPDAEARKDQKKQSKKKDTNKFNQFQQNTYDFDELEKQLLSN